MMTEGFSEKYRPLRALRGGSYWNDADNLRSTNRNRNEADNRNDNIGFRLVVAANTLTKDDDHRAGGIRACCGMPN